MNCSQPLLSVIVPVYQTEKFLARCLSSILQQTYRNIEVIVVFDASKDQSMTIIQEFAERDPRIRLCIHEANRGLFQSRITGAMSARGDYLTFVDSDDHISVDWLRLLIEKAHQTDADMVIGDFLNEYAPDKTEYYCMDPIRGQDLMLTGSQVLSAFMKQQGLFFGWHTVWNKLYRKDLWDRCLDRFTDFSARVGHLTMTEDIAFSAVFWSTAKRVTNVHHAYYYYVRHNKQSTSAASFAKFSKNLRNVATVFAFFKEQLKICGQYETYRVDYEKWLELYQHYWSNYAGSVEHRRQKEAKELFTQLFDLKDFVPGKKEYHYFYSKEANLFSSFQRYEALKKAIADEDKDYVSFDVFDTLILRPFYQPSDLFLLLNKSFNQLSSTTAYVDFAQIRKWAENEARKQLSGSHEKQEDVTLEEIYEAIAIRYPFERKILHQLMEQEMALELSFSYCRQTGDELYGLARFFSKKILFISDMYLPGQLISQMLTKNGYEGTLFVSSEERALKNSGLLFRNVMDRMGIKADKLLHIGDNSLSDVAIPQRLGITAFHLPRCGEVFDSGSLCQTLRTPGGGIFDRTEAMEHLGYRCMLALTANRIYDNPFTQADIPESFYHGNPFYIGYHALGMHLYSVALWLLLQTKNRSGNTIHFAARDGYLPMKAYQLIADSSAPGTNYLYHSRKAMLALQCCDPVDSFSLPSSININSLSPRQLLFLVPMLWEHDSPDKAQKICSLHGIDFEKPFCDLKAFTEFMSVFHAEIKSPSLCETYRSLLKDYFGGMIQKGDVIFDLGYSGRNEFMLSALLQFPVDAYYIHRNKDIAAMRSSTAGFTLHTYYEYKPAALVIVREHLFSASEPSCIGYEASDWESTEAGCASGDARCLQPVFEPFLHNIPTECVTTMIQDAALCFVKDMRDTFSGFEDLITCPGFYASMPYEHFLHYSSAYDRELFAVSSFEDSVFGGENIPFLDFWNRELIRNGLLKEGTVPDAGLSSPAGAGYHEPQIYADGLYIALFQKLNRLMPFGSRRREFIKKLFKKPTIGKR